MESNSKQHCKRKVSYYSQHAATDKNYDPEVSRPDADPAEMELRIARYMDMLKDWQLKRKIIGEETRDQASSGIWQCYRTKLLTASHFGHICKMRDSTSCASRVQNIVYPQEIQIEALQHGIETENLARRC